MSWENILKNKTMEEMIRALWRDWLDGLESYVEYNYEQIHADKGRYIKEGDSYYARLFTKLTSPLYRLDPINDADKIMDIIGKLDRHPDMPLETLGYPTVGLEHAEEDVRNEYESIGEY